MKSHIVLVAIVMTLAFTANAQQPGSAQYNSVFLPAHGVGDTVRHPRKDDRWGAMAFSSENSLTGFSLDGRSRELAEQAAIDMCLKRGGGTCTIDFSFANKCAAVVTGNGRTVSVEDLSLRAAKKAASRRCGRGCRILYEGCAIADGDR